MSWGSNAVTEYAIGIDTGTKTGFALWDKKKKALVEVKTLPLWKALELVKHYHTTHKVRVYVEDARKAKFKAKTDDQSKMALARVQGAGSIKRDASIWQEFLEDNNIPHELLMPNYKLTKLSPAKFQTYTKYTGLTSNHSRDAAMIVYGR